MPRKIAEKPVERKSRTTKSETTSTTSNPTNDLSLLIPMNGGFKAKNKTQKDYAKLINDKEIVIAAGPAGVGKSYVTIIKALELLKDNSNNYKKIVISKPAVEAEEKQGFLPGDVREKMDPFVHSSMSIFDKIIGKPNRLKLEEMELISVQALAYIRGESIDNSIVIMEEAQNMSPSQMKTFLTRIGENSKFLVSGDLDQSDRYKDYKKSGLYDAIQRHKNVEGIGFIEFSNAEVVRNPIISKILNNYKREEFKPKTVETLPVQIEVKSFWESLLEKIFGSKK